MLIGRIGVLPKYAKYVFNCFIDSFGMSGQQYSVGENSGYFQHGQVDSSMLDLNCSPSTMNETEDNTNSELLELGRIWDFEIDVNEFNKQFQVVIAAESTANVPTMIQQNEVQKPTDQEAMIFDSPSSGESSQSSSHKLDSPERQLKKKPLSPYMLYSKEVRDFLEHFNLVMI